ncbi:MAG: CoA ester lyase [Alphaproteobacteria bacterium]|nr:CoA ester lyase [Alphaproteobacteria bacterium]HCP01831.1 CoA ester lyase [Rhodospirillaceae bacterium]
MRVTMSISVQPRRSFIFSPGTDPSMFTKALASGADIVCVELEDGVAPHDKDAARANMLKIFADEESTTTGDGVERIVRVNELGSAFGQADMDAIYEAAYPPPALMLPKVNNPEEVRGVSDKLDKLGLPVRLQIIIETNHGLEAAYEIAHASNRIDSLLFGGVDLAADLRCEYAWEPLLYARARVVHAAAAAGIDAIDVPWLDLRDFDGLRQEAQASARLGFTGKGAIHPNQIEIINEIFSPSPEEACHARKIIAAFAEANTGLVVVDGKLIERPVLRTMERIVAIANRTTS